LDIKYIKGVGDKRAEAFRKIGINSLDDFLNFIPRTYLKKIPVSDLSKNTGENVLISGRISHVSFPAKSSHPTRIFLNDGTGEIEIPVFGGSEFRKKQFRLNEHYLFWGKVNDAFYGVYTNLNYRDHLKINTSDPNEKELLKFSYIPIYELSGVLKKTWIKPLLLSKIVFNAFSALLKTKPEVFRETIPPHILKSGNYMLRRDAILRINFPHVHRDIESARKTLAFEELFYLELILALRKLSTKNEIKGIKFDKDIKELKENFKKTFEFELTGAQKKVMNEIYLDMKSEHVMNKLLQGDVGSGKTIVSIFALLTAVENGYQAALMCPTEILAEQHYLTVSKFLNRFNDISGKEYKVCLLVGGQKKRLREEILQGIRLGKTNLIIGTHALIQEKVEYNNLGFAVIDEQHKFGVMQRAKLKDKGLNPDVLVMTATPIPRTLSLTYYGDLDVSIIDELPGNRKKIKTALRLEEDKFKVFDFVRNEVKKGRQAFIIYPIIDESEKLDLKSAEENYILLKEKVFPELNVGMVHGRKFWYEIDEEMQAFKDGKTNVMVATTVIEVGIDIPNATIMIIEDAQRFGLSQLHQLRGRVGRGSEQSYCIFVAKNLDEVSKERLNTLCQTTDGFKIAEKDMEIRGPGEFFGIRQSGIINFSCTDLNKDKDIVESARDIAFKIIDDDPHLRKAENELIKESFLKNYKDALYYMKIA